MIKVERISVMNFDNAIRGARNPLNSWDKADSHYDEQGNFVLGPNDLSLAKRLCDAGSDHRKFIRQIMISMDITAPLYWWKEFDTYKVGTTANSTSTMHKIHAKEFSLEDFSIDHMNEAGTKAFEVFVEEIERQRKLYLETKDKEYWYTMIQMLPSSYNQMRTVTMNYENVRNMFASRKNHKLAEWHTFCDHIRELPYAKELIGTEE